VAVFGKNFVLMPAWGINQPGTGKRPDSLTRPLKKAEGGKEITIVR
jgi:hypothetical protein